MRSRSAFSSPTSSTPNSPLSSTVYSKKLAEKGCTHHGEDRLSPDIRRRDEANLSRQSSMTSLKGSLCNLRGSVQNLSSPTESPNLNKYRSMVCDTHYFPIFLFSEPCLQIIQSQKVFWPTEGNAWAFDQTSRTVALKGELLREPQRKQPIHDPSMI